MSYVFSHAFIPLSILFIFSGILNLKTKNILYLSFFGIFPDLDAVFIHRETFHNIFVLMVPILLFIFIKDFRQITGISTFYISSHLILDIFDGGIHVLYPISTKILFIYAEIGSTYNVGTIITKLNYGFTDKVIKTVPIHGYGIVSSENCGIAVLLSIMILILLLKFVIEKQNKRTKNR